MHACNYCSSKNHTYKYPTYDIWDNTYQINYCNDCKAYFLSPFPSVEMLTKAYDESYYGCSEKKFKGPVEKVLDYFRQKRARSVSKLLADGGKVLDIGCGNGHFLLSLKKYGSYQLYGSELAGKSAQRTAQNKEINLLIGHLNFESFKDVKFDVITLFHVFEHLTEPRLMLDTIKYYLKDDAYLVLSFPNINSWQSRMFKGRWLHLDPPRHLFFFAPPDFIKLMKDHGFILIRKSFFSLEQNPYGYIQSFLNIFLKKREVLFENLKGNMDYTKNYSSLSLLFQKLLFAIIFPFAILGDAFASLFAKGATVEFVFKYKKC